MKKKKSPASPSDQKISTGQNASTFGIKPLFMASMVSSLLLLMAFPPMGWSWLAWIAPIGWLMLCDRRVSLGLKGYLIIWLSGCLFWLVSLHSVRLAFWALYFGWIAMSLYLAIYIPAFVAVTRVLWHGWKVPLLLAAPIAWTAMELVRSHLMTGYAANSLAHSQALKPTVIQVIDQVGTGGLGFLMMMFAACLLTAVENLREGLSRRAYLPAIAGVLVLVSIGGYGKWRLMQADQLIENEQPLFRCLLLQENTPSVFEMSPNLDNYYERAQSSWTRYLNLCRSAVREHGPVDLVAWPESTFTATSPMVKVEIDENRLPETLQSEMRMHGITFNELESSLRQSKYYFDRKVHLALLAAHGLDVDAELPAKVEPSGGFGTNEMPQEPPSPELLVGCDHVLYAPDGIYRTNSALWIRADGTIKDHYAKMHLVMFGEYIPLRPMLNWLGDMFGFASINPGDRPKSFAINGANVCPSICFESMMPRLIRWQVQELDRRQARPDVLINLTNDSWFKGTTMLDHHLASSILCSVENRLPMLVAANTGLSAEIDGSGRVLNLADRRTVRALLAQPHRDGRWGLVQSVGYPLSWLCLAIALLGAITAIIPGIVWQRREAK